jgi:hypothetical protein
MAVASFLYTIRALGAPALHFFRTSAHQPMPAPRSQAQGLPRVRGFWDFGASPDVFSSHTCERKWETFRFFGTLNGHLAGLPASRVAGIRLIGT